MTGRRSTRSETLPDAAELLRVVGEARKAVTSACARVPPTGPTYAALQAVIDATDALALRLTGRADHYHAPGHGTPGPREG